MPFGYWGRILQVDLSAGRTWEDLPDEAFYRRYIGGGAIGARYLLTEAVGVHDPYDPAALMVFAPSVLTGAPLHGLSRFSVTALSPLTGTIGDSQAGGWWGVELKAAGFDAVVIRGRAQRPVYLWISDGRCEIRDASALWGQEPKEAQAAIRRELGDPKIQVAQIGRGGEQLVRFASIVHNLRHTNGRTGMGAVMGSKNLKAVAVRGHARVPVQDPKALNAIARRGTKAIPDKGTAAFLQALGTMGAVRFQNAAGGLPTRNWESGVFEGAAAIDGQHIHETIFKGEESCYACAVKCRKVVGAEEPYVIDPAYGAPEYEGLAMLGALTGVTEMHAVVKASELCARYTLDVISCGAAVALAMECAGKGIIPAEVEGVELKFGSAEALLYLVEAIADRRSVGAVLAEGTARAAQVWGHGAEDLVVAVKGNDLPAHLPQLKQALAVIYAANPFGADHESSEHDGIMNSEGKEDRAILASLGVHDRRAPGELDAAKVRFAVRTQYYYSALDSLTICMFVFGLGSGYLYDPVDLPPIIRAVTGWEVTVDELLEVGARRVNLMRLVGMRQGFDREQDTLPPKVFRPLPEGSSSGRRVDRETWSAAMDEYYQQMGWDRRGLPTADRLAELGLEPSLLAGATGGD